MLTQDDAPTAVISNCSQYRYFLSRRINSSLRIVTFIGLNPSTADETRDDPTIRRCVNFAKEWGAGALWMVNLFAFRATKPAVLLGIADPIGSDNDVWLERAISSSDVVVAAWGNEGRLLGRAEVVSRRYAGRLLALSITKSGMPGHPLYIRADTKPVPVL